MVFLPTKTTLGFPCYAEWPYVIITLAEWAHSSLVIFLRFTRLLCLLPPDILRPIFSVNSTYPRIFSRCLHISKNFVWWRNECSESSELLAEIYNAQTGIVLSKTELTTLVCQLSHIWYSSYQGHSCSECFLQICRTCWLYVRLYSYSRLLDDRVEVTIETLIWKRA